ncbi:hypothetical protein LguiA_001284 [Lonicera macranthoides]
MCVTTFTDEYTFSDIPKSRLFKALALDSHNLIPKIIPEAIKSIQLSRGNGGAGTIKQINLAQGDTHVKYYVDALNEDECVYTYSLIEGDQLTDKLEKITYEVQFKTLENGGAVSKVTSSSSGVDWELSRSISGSSKSVCGQRKWYHACAEISRGR